MDSLLNARESRFAHILQVIQNEKVQVILVKANTPGIDKNIIEAKVMVRMFTKLILSKFQILTWDIFPSSDGDYALLTLREKDLIGVKKTLITIENEHPLGRLVDLDLYVDASYAISRVSLSLDPRTCYLCQDDARVCSKLKRHSYEELIHYMKTRFYTYLHQMIETVIDEAMMMELNLEDKFGLVTPTSSGSHPDMNYALMIKAKHAIMPFFIQMFDLGFHSDDLDQIFQKSRIIGMIAEEKMLAETEGVNCYKGLIFILGLIMISTGYTLQKSDHLSSVFDHIKHVTRHITTDFEMKRQTFGEQAYKIYRIQGARGEAMAGLPSVQYGFNYLIKHDLGDLHLRSLLKDITLMIEDTVLLKRSQSIEFYHQVKSQLKKLDVQDALQLQKFNDFCITNRLSFGGAADLLIASIFLYQLNQIL